jgi:UDP-N-acetylmuramoylalanine--D-glutamate ligase
MVPTPQYAGAKVVVMGLGKSGLSAATSLRASGADVRVWDDKEAAVNDMVAKGFDKLDDQSLAGVKALVLSPGVPHTYPQKHPLATQARAKNIPITCDVDLLAEAQSAATFVGITGTNGKSTTTSLVAHLLQHAGRQTAVGGNLGTPALDLDALGRDGTYVLELSSYQLELVPHLACNVAVLLNITPDHLARHGGLDGYIAAKRRIFDHQRGPSVAIVGIDDEPSAALCVALRGDGKHRVWPISSQKEAPGGVYAVDGVLIDATGEKPVTVLDLKPVPRLPGAHNWQNAAAATAVARALNIPHDIIAAGIKMFPGLMHRQELVGVVDNVAFVNDSKATNADATEKALVCYDNIYWLLGGQAKEGGIAPLASLFPRIRHAFLIGEAADDFAKVLQGRVPFTHHHQDMSAAIENAGRMALADKLPGATVLLSPACASWDMFKSFEDRGDQFRAHVQKLWPETKGTRQ